MPLVLGLLGGVAIALATVLVEHSRIEFGRYALYGNGAFAVPAVGVPLALYAGWTELARSHAERARRVAVALFTAGLYFGIGAWSPLEVVLFPQSSVERLADAIPGCSSRGSCGSSRRRSSRRSSGGSTQRSRSPRSRSSWGISSGC